MTITPDVVMAASIGVLVVERGWSILKELRNGNGRNGHCADHSKFIESFTEVATDVKWIRKIISNNGRNGGHDFHMPDLRD